ncbi:MFS transporter [Paraburkholderia sp. BCC1876]|uniref:MFS transporter n=1 Tax=Paraburkholderia sp. BCC1876 TaxID=2676303 RepID=UPI0015924BC2|nr:MFS transporter [Paraburkholderia sp. BCC1876]
MDTTFSRKQKTAALTSLFIAWAAGYADRILISTAIIPIRAEFNLDARQAGIVLSAFYFSYAITQLIGGWLSDKIGSRIVVVACVASWSFFTGATGVAWSFASLVAIRLLFGIGEGAFSPASSVTIAEVFPRKERARAKSLLISTTFLGNAVGSGLIGLTVARFGWRSSFTMLAVMGLVVAAILWASLRGGMKAQRERNANRHRTLWGPLLRMPAAWKIAAIWFFASVLYVGVTSWMPSYLMHTYHIDLAHTGMAVAIPNLLAFIGTNAVGYLLDRRAKGHERAFMIGGALVSALSIALMINTTSMTLLMVYLTVCLLAFNFVYASVFAMPLRYFPEHLIGSATGLMNFGGQMGATLAPIAMGALINASGGAYISAFWLLIGSAVGGVLVAATWKPIEPRMGESVQPS